MEVCPMINFTVLTDTPGRVRQFLLDRGIIKQVTNPRTGATQYVGARDGVEFTATSLPNPIVVTPAVGEPGTRDNPNPDYVPPVYDDRKVFLIRLGRAAEDD